MGELSMRLIDEKEDSRIPVAAERDPGGVAVYGQRSRLPASEVFTRIFQQIAEMPSAVMCALRVPEVPPADTQSHNRTQAD